MVIEADYAESDSGNAVEPSLTRSSKLGLLSGIFIGAAAGLIGVSGREFRIPVLLQPIQALAQARTDYLNSVLAYNRAQFRLYRAIGRPPVASPPPATPLPAAGATPAMAPNGRARLATSSDADPRQVGSSRTGAR